MYKLFLIATVLVIANLALFVSAGGYGHGGGYGGGYGHGGGHGGHGGYGRHYGGHAYVNHHQSPHHYQFGLNEHGAGHTKHHHQTASTYGGYGGGYGGGY